MVPSEIETLPVANNEASVMNPYGTGICLVLLMLNATLFCILSSKPEI